MTALLNGESLEDYARRLERRIKNQRDHIDSLIGQQREGNRRLRKKLDYADRAIGRACIAAERRKEQRDAVIAERDRLRSLMRKVERNCPCGARPESLHTHSHVIGCPVGEALGGTVADMYDLAIQAGAFTPPEAPTGAEGDRKERAVSATRSAEKSDK